MSKSRDADDVTRELIDWVKDRCPGTPAAALSLADSDPESGIGIRLIQVSPRMEPRARDRLIRTLALDYLISIRADDPLAEHRLVAELAFAIMDMADYELVADQSAAQACLASGLAPTAGLVIRSQARRVDDIAQAPLVREPAIMRVAPLGFVDGIVLGPGDLPIPGATVTLGDGDRSAVTGPDGRFRFASPADAPVQVAARAHGRANATAAAAGKPAVIKLPLEA
jgi:hypothetical protein